MDLRNKKMWITGASSGIGEAVARVSAAKGAQLILSARNEEKLNALKAELPNSEQHIVAPLDLSKAEEISEKVAQVLSKVDAVDVLFNNGGIGQRGSARETILDVQRKVMEVNYFGTIALTQAVLPAMVRKQSGMIATVASVAGLVGGKSMAGYSASKHAIVGYMDCLRAEETHNGIKVLNICPGFVQTQISVNAMKGNGEQFAEMASSIKHGIPADECAEKIVSAMEQEKAQIVIGKGISYWAPTIYKFFPSLFRKMAAAKNYRE